MYLYLHRISKVLNHIWNIHRFLVFPRLFSSLHRALQAFLSRTQRVVRSAQLATATLQLLSSTLDALDVEVAATWHRCGYCEELRPTVQAALEKLENYLAKSPVATQRALEGLEDLEGPGGFEKTWKVGRVKKIGRGLNMCWNADFISYNPYHIITS